MDGAFAPAAETAVSAIAANAAAVDRDGAFPWDSLDRLRAAGLLGLTASPEDGGAGAGLARSCSLVREVGGACASTGLILGMQLTHLRASTLWPAPWRAAVGQGAVLSGKLINALRVEPALGTPARGGLPATVARRTETGWSLSGHKIYSTGAPGLAWMLVFAATDEPEPRSGQFLVDASLPGIRIEQSWDQMGLRGSGSHDVFFDSVALPAEAAVDLRPPAGWGRPDPAAVAWNTLIVAALYSGVAEAARDWVVGFLRNRVPANLGAPLASLPRMQEAVGRIQMLLVTNRRLVDGAAAEHDAGRTPAPAELGLVKTLAAENAVAAVTEAMALAGNHGLSRAFPLERHLRDVSCAPVHTPQPDAAFLAAGRLALGVS